MKSPFLIPLAIPLLALGSLNSCSTVKETYSKARSSTTKTLQAAKEKTLGASKPKIKLTKADPTRFLPEGTSTEAVLNKATDSQATKKQTMLLAKHTEATSPPRPPRPTSSQPSLSQTEPNVLATIPPLELPPLPESSESDNKEFKGILPSLNGNDDATFIDVHGEALELPPMDLPEIEDEAEVDAQS